MEKLNAVEMGNSLEQKSETKPKSESELKPTPKPPPPKLKVFEITQKYFATMDITPSLANQPYPFNWTILIGLLMLIAAICCTSAFVIYDAETPTDYTQSAYSCSLVAIIMSGLFSFVFKVEKLYEVINGYEDLVNTTLNYSATKSIFTETVRSEQRLNEIVYFVMVEMTPVCVYLPLFIYTNFVYFTIDAGPDAFVLPAPAWFPFDWRNPIGYAFVMASECMVLVYMTLIGASVLTLAIGSYLYLVASSKCIKASLSAIGQCTTIKTNRNILKQLIEFIEFHSFVKQLLCNYSELFRFLFTPLFVWSLVTICGALLLVQTQLLHHHDNSAVLLITIFEIIYAFGTLLLACEVCQRVNIAFEECNGMIVQFECDTMPYNNKHMRTEVGSIVKKAFSYFTILRTFY